MKEVFQQKIEQFVEWKDANFLRHGNGMYYAKTSSQYFDITKYSGAKEKPTKYYALFELVELYKK